MAVEKLTREAEIKRFEVEEWRLSLSASGIGADHVSLAAPGRSNITSGSFDVAGNLHLVVVFFSGTDMGDYVLMQGMGLMVLPILLHRLVPDMFTAGAVTRAMCCAEVEPEPGPERNGAKKSGAFSVVILDSLLSVSCSDLVAEQ